MAYVVVSGDEFLSASGLGDWRVVAGQAHALFRTRDFATGLRLVAEIGRIAEAADHHPDVNLRYGVVEVRVSTHDTQSLTTVDIALARAISAAARDLGVKAEPSSVRAWDGR
ncbi:4a-hydroxytetrahydrobiopterin dehydratase [Nocardioides sp. zg-536]|uniref:Putative pterin-4-alpha-carbinolamine dehydratase n=1 Tax=Nocardioides faecalis TaxID=2803858 RepID=A0A938Y6B6_9ACTN|nr:4a-hydroxytetrahydrobiopterin dehydratase [Nocardioides faecalis]MBM9460027.1 4a-hydroxytetrahydrobiopterin dehydratase [Nocardioides faecalis]MBS4753105.1 4a-hydroxytetrahydrobiopterin dehydratase [Nocardioides faecalis]QVI58753.1 4a-hydroxytetrahydrobiopterin dehydratase [Nocardioides faecalis]